MYKNNWFQHSLFVPVDFALCIYNIMHNKATVDDWNLIDSYRIKNTPVFTWIEDILIVNKVKNVEQEMKWFIREIER